jgi:transposase
MGYRGKLAEQQQARQLRRTGLPLAEIAARLDVSKSSVSLWVRDVEFTPLPRPPRGRRRDPNALQRRKRAEIDRLVEEGGSGSASCRSGSSWSPGWRCTRGKGASGTAR